MTNFLIVFAADLESTAILSSLGGRAHGPRLAIVKWWGTAEQLFRYLAVLSQIVAIVSLDGDCFVGRC